MFKGTKLLFLAMAIACGFAGTAKAASSLASGPISAGNNEGEVACIVVNVGNAPIHFVTTELVGEFKAPLTQNFNDCTTRQSLVPGAMCSFQADVNAQNTALHQAVACKVTISEAKASIRGTLIALDPMQGPPLSQADLH